MTELLDIDLDAVVRHCAGTPPGEQAICASSFGVVRNALARTADARWFMDEHGEALRIWQELGVVGARVWHVDAHHDAYGSTDPLVWGAALSHGFPYDDRITSATYLLAAWRAGIVHEVVWLVPPWLGLDAAERDLRRELGKRTAPFTLALLGSVELPTRPFAAVTCAWSRRWVDPWLHAGLVADPRLAPAARAVAEGAATATF
jgi:hypothetical protein